MRDGRCSGEYQSERSVFSFDVGLRFVFVHAAALCTTALARLTEVPRFLWPNLRRSGRHSIIFVIINALIIYFRTFLYADRITSHILRNERGLWLRAAGSTTLRNLKCPIERAVIDHKRAGFFVFTLERGQCRPAATTDRFLSSFLFPILRTDCVVRRTREFRDATRTGGGGRRKNAQKLVIVLSEEN